MDARRILYIGPTGESTDSRIMSLRAAGMEVDTVTAFDAVPARATETQSQIVVVDLSCDAPQARKVARAFGDSRATRALPVVLVGVNPSEMTVTRSKVPRARAMFVVGASAGEVAAVVARVPLAVPRTKQARKAKRSKVATKRKAALRPSSRSRGSARPTVRE
ncbi:MAG: hypothetical protein HYY84_05980 [Deltaproteobacteria bacterium]|nr:hypothetical protein [Deltaproteobacteria bacterium]